MASPNNSELIIISITHGSTALGVPVGYAFEDIDEYVEIPGEGVVGPTTQGRIRRALTCDAEWLVGSAIAPGTDASLVIVVQKSDASGNVTHTLSNMRASTYGHTYQKNGQPGRYRQRFICVSSFSTDQHAQA